MKNYQLAIMRSLHRLLKNGHFRPFYSFFFLLMAFYSPAIGQSSKTITGIVLDETKGEPVAGVNITIKDSQKGTITDAKGRFSISASPGSVLVISNVGFKTTEITVGNRTTLNIRLSVVNEQLNDVIVVGYGVQRKATLSGSVAVVNAKTFENRGPIANPVAALQGQVPGVIVTRTSAQPGRENWQLQIRGATSTNTQEPLIILDGVALQNSGELNSINPADIDNISFLKDASAAIYGARAAFGVVLVSTKRAKSDKVTVEYRGSVSRKLLALQPDLLVGKQYGLDFTTALNNDNYGIPNTAQNVYILAQYFINPPDSGWFDVTTIPGYNGTTTGLFYNGRPVPPFGDVKDFTFFPTNMQKILFGNATSTEHSLSISGRTEKQGYRISMSYLNDGSQLRWGLNGNNRYTLRLNHDYTLSSKTKLETNISLEKNDIFQPTVMGGGNYGVTSQYANTGKPAFTKDGKPYAWGGVYSAAAQAEYGGANKEYNSRVLINTRFTYNILKHLSFTGTAGYNAAFTDIKIQQKSIQFYTYSGLLPVNSYPSAGGVSGTSAYYQRQLNKDPYYNMIGQFEYHNSFKAMHDINIMAGASYERDEYDSYNTKTFNLGNENLPSLGLGISSSSAGFVTNGETQNHYALGSYFSRVRYGYKNKYLLEAVGRYDGSSKFIQENRWKAFYGVSGAWRISQESFMQDVKFVNELKLRASFGQTGNQGGIGLYDYVQSLNVNTGGAFLGSATSISVTTTPGLVSLNRTWETVQNKNLALDFSVLHSRLSGTFEVFRKENINMLLGQSFPAALGATAPAANIGELKTWGWEGVLTWSDRIGKDLTFSVSVNMTDNQNKLVHYGGANVLSAGYNSTVEGYSLGSYFGLKYDGRIQEQKTLDAYNAKYAPTGSTNNVSLPIPAPLANPPGQLSGLRPGDNMFKDVNGDGKLSIGTSTTNPGDLIYLGRDDPRYSYGINLGLQWKGIDFYTIFQGVAKRTIFRDGTWRIPFGNLSNAQSSFYRGKLWSPENPNGTYPNLHSGGGINTYNYQISSWSVENGAYIRLKNLVIGYTLPEQIMKKIKAIQKFRIYFSGSDLWESSHIHDGWDPETTRTAVNNERFPFYRYVTFGVNATF